MRVLLVRPPRRHPAEPGLSVPPLGLAYLAAAVREAGAEVAIADAWALRWTPARLAEEARRLRPDVVGITAMTPTADAAARAAAAVRPHARFVVLGGPHATAVREAVLDEIPELDAAVVGEGERTLPALLDWLGRPGPPPPGVLARGHPFRPAPRERDLARLPRPARDLLPRGVYRYPLASRPGFETAVTSRGCPFGCTFCDTAVSGRAWRARPAGDVVDELEHLVRDRGAGFVSLYDDNFTLRRDRVLEICAAMRRRGLRLRWKCEARVDGVDGELLREMAAAGCDCVAFGVESANPASLRLLGKRTDPDDARRAFALARAAGIRTLAYLILGVPGETEADVLRTVRFALEIGADYAQFSTLSALPGTPLAERVAPTAAATGPLDADARRPVLTDLPPERLDALVRRAWLRFYARPRPAARLLRDAVRSGSLGELVRVGALGARWALTRSARAGARAPRR